MRYKICLNCSYKNHEDDIACLECGSSLDGVPVTAATQDGNRRESSSQQPTADRTEPKDATSPTPLTLVHESKTEHSFRIGNGAVLGRGSDIDMTALDPHCYISARHARFSWDSGQWCVEILSEVNPSKHNGCPLRRGRKFGVRPGDRLEFAGQVFILEA